MANKLIIGGLIVVLVGALSLGIYNWTQNNGTAHAGQGTAYASGGGQGYQGGRSGDEVTPGSTEPGQGYGRAQAGDLPQGGEAYSLREPDPRVHVEEWFTLTGQVTSVDTTGLTLQTDDGQTLSIDLGPEWFWSDQGMTLAAGERVTVQVFDEDGEIKIGQIRLESDGTLLQLRDDDGRPLWAGRGRGGGRQ